MHPELFSMGRPSGRGPGGAGTGLLPRLPALDLALLPSARPRHSAAGPTAALVACVPAGALVVGGGTSMHMVSWVRLWS